MSKMERVNLKVSGMSCGHCEKRVVTALERLDGVKDAKAFARDGEVTVEFDTEKAGIEQIRETILDCGYTPL